MYTTMQRHAKRLAKYILHTRKMLYQLSYRGSPADPVKLFLFITRTLKLLQGTGTAATAFVFSVFKGKLVYAAPFMYMYTCTYRVILRIVKAGCHAVAIAQH